jgi:hypothetical protein
MHNPIVIIALAGVAAFAFGSVYYIALGKRYQAALGRDPEGCKGQKPPLGPLATCLVAEWIMAAVLYQLLVNLGTTGALGGAIAGATIGLGFMATSTVVNNAFPGRKVMLSVIDSIHWIAVAAIEGAVIGALT